jgi:hypothetical protein
MARYGHSGTRTARNTVVTFDPKDNEHTSKTEESKGIYVPLEDKASDRRKRGFVIWDVPTIEDELCNG